MKFSSANIGFAAAALVVFAGLYWFFAPGESSNIEELPLSEASSIPLLESRFLELATQLNGISFNTTIFTDPRFSALIDITKEIIPEPAGRTDPFAPISASKSPRSNPDGGVL